MNVFHRITRQTLLKNRARTVVTIFGIILSTAMFTAVTTFISTLQNHLLLSSIAVNGDWYGSVRAADTALVEQIVADNRVTHVAKAQVLGYSQLAEENCEGTPYLYVLGADDAFLSTMPVNVKEGRLPANDLELAVSERLSLVGRIDLSIGDVITIPLSYRVQDGAFVFQRAPYAEGETLSFREERTYTVVGILQDSNLEYLSDPGYLALTWFATDVPAGTVSDCYFKLAKAGDTQMFLDALDVEGTSVNRDVLMYMGISGYASFMASFFSLAAILIGLIVFGSVSLIYNAFSISVSERTRQFGLLVSIGATKKQLRSSVFFEAVLLSSIGIPVGVLCGMLGLGVTLRLLSGMEFLENMRLYASPIAILLAAVIALVTVLISAYVPAKRAMHVSAIDAIRQTADVQACAVREPSYRLTLRLFGLPGMLAAKHFRRSRRRYRATIVSLFLSIVLFISASAFSHYLTIGVTGAFDTSDRDLYIQYTQNDPQERSAADAFDLIESDPDATAVTGVFLSQYGTLYVAKDCLQPDAAEDLTWRLEDDAVGANCCAMNFLMLVVDDASFCACLTNQGLEVAPFFAEGNPRALIGRVVYEIDYEEGRILQYEPFLETPEGMRAELLDETAYAALSREELEQTSSRDYMYDVFLGGGTIVDTLPYGLNGRDGNTGAVTLVYPVSNAPAALRMDDATVTCYLQAGDAHEAVAERYWDDTLQQDGYASFMIVDYIGMNEDNRDLVLAMNVFAYGFIVLISLIAVANVFNTISTNVQLRRREFAMLKSVGMTRRGFRRMMNYECLLYGCKALLLGLPVSFGIAWLTYRAINRSFATVFRPPLLPFAIAIGSVFLVVFVTMLYAMHRVERENLIDALKSENQ